MGRPLLAFATLLMAVLPVQSQTPPEVQAQPGCGPRIIVEYTDDAPDYFIIKNRSPEGWSLAMLAIDLGQSAGPLVFDPDEGGDGVGGASPFEPNMHARVKLVTVVPAGDGGQALALHFEGFAAGLDYSFHIDLDAVPEGGRRTWVLPQDIKGSRVLASLAGPTGAEDGIEALFDERATADSGAGGCV
jgi:hypothetical protein